MSKTSTTPSPAARSPWIVTVGELPAAGRIVTVRLEPGALGDTVRDAYEALGPAEGELEVTPLGGNVLVRGKMRLRLAYACSRTGEPGETTLDVQVSELYEPGPAAMLDLDAGVAVDALEDALEDEPYRFVDGRIDLEPLIREQLVLAQAPFPVRPDASEPPEGPCWQSDPDAIDPRWDALKNIELA